MNLNKLGYAALCLIGGVAVKSLASGPWDPSQLKKVEGKVADYAEERGRRRSCFKIRLAGVTEFFELCSTSYRNFDQGAFEREVRKGTALEMLVVNEIKRNQATGDTKYWVEDLRTPGGRIYLNLADVQAEAKMEADVAGVLSPGLGIAALAFVVLAFKGD